MRHGIERKSIRLLELQRRGRHLQILKTFLIPSMNDHLMGKLRDNFDSLRRVEDNLATVQALSMPSTMPFMRLTSGGMEDYAEMAAEHMISCSARSVFIPERLHPSC